MDIKDLIFCFLLLIAVFFISHQASAARFMLESEYVNETCPVESVEIKNSDNTRTDCLNDVFSIEYDFADKWAECVGQAKHYARLNGNLSACVLIIENYSDCKYVARAKGLGVPVYLIDLFKYCGTCV